MKYFWHGVFASISLLAFTGCASLDRQTYSGDSFGSPPIGQVAFVASDPSTNRSGLSGFHFNYDEGDKQLKLIEAGVLLNSPWNSPFPIYANYRDDKGSGSYSWRIDRVILPFRTRVGSVTDCIYWNNPDNNFYRERIPESPANLVPAIVGFKLYFSGLNQHVSHFKVDLSRDEAGELILSVELFDPMIHDYCFEVSYALIPPNNVRNIGDLEVTGAGSFERDIDAENPVLKSFRLEFTSHAGELDETGVLVSPGRASGWFDNSGNDDQFKINVEWVDLQEDPWWSSFLAWLGLGPEPEPLRPQKPGR